MDESTSCHSHKPESKFQANHALKLKLLCIKRCSYVWQNVHLRHVASPFPSTLCSAHLWMFLGSHWNRKMRPRSSRKHNVSDCPCLKDLMMPKDVACARESTGSSDSRIGENEHYRNCTCCSGNATEKSQLVLVEEAVWPDTSERDPT